MNYFIRFSYDGRDFCGYQIQKEGRSVQGEIEKVLSQIFNEKVKISASGRTDAKVHALNQCANFKVEKTIDTVGLQKALNSLLSDDIFIKEVKVVADDFHARFSATAKEYVYRINLNEYDVFKKDYVLQYNNLLDIDKMKIASKHLIGEHDFTSFSKTDLSKPDKIRTIFEIDIEQKEELIIRFKGNGFLRYMVRNIVGALIDVGASKISSDELLVILEEKDRRKSSKTAPPEGLYLSKVTY